jgi:predicted DNA-binding transcriptional regulator AlpA
MAKEPSILGEYLNQRELAHELGIATITLTRWHQTRTGPPRTKMGRRVLYRRSSVQDWLAAHQEHQPIARRGGRS